MGSTTEALGRGSLENPKHDHSMLCTSQHCIIRGDEFDGDVDDDSDDDDDDDNGVPSQAASGVRRAVIEVVANL